MSARERNCSYLNIGDARFANVSAVTGWDFPDDARGIALVDWDRDGDLDLWVTNRTAPRVRLLRNDATGENHFLALQLQGTTCNRDAIGARVEARFADASKPVLIKTVRAGEGFVSQSSKTVHFGLGKEDRLDSVTIRWPGGDVDVYRDLPVDRRYRMIQGQASPQLISDAPRKLALKRSTATAPEPSLRSRALLTRRKPLLRFAYLDMAKGRQVFQPSGRPVLINLWASWCQPCLKELKELAEAEDQWSEAGLDILALSTDLIPEISGSNPQAAKQIADRFALPFSVGFASREFVEYLTQVDNSTFYFQRALPIPTSFLIDAKGRMAAIYKGPVTVEQLQQDLGKLALAEDQIQAAALPFPGLDGLRLFPLSPLSFAQAYFDGQYYDDARKAAKDYIEAEQAADATAESDDSSAQRKLGAAYRLLARIESASGNIKEQVAALQALVESMPADPLLRGELALATWGSGDADEAIQMLESLAQQYPSTPGVLDMVARLMLHMQQFDRAVDFHRQAAELAPRNAVMRFHLGVALQAAEETAEAVNAYQQAYDMDGQLLSAANNLAWIYATSRDPERKDPSAALKLATAACDPSKRDGVEDADAGYLDTLAAAQAANANFTEAVQTARKAIAIFEEAGQPEQAELVRQRLALYEQGESYRE